MNFLSVVVDTIIPPLMNLVATHLNYLVEVDDNVEALRNAMKDLVNVRDDVKIKVDIAERENLTPVHQVVGWLSETASVATEVEAIRKDYDERCKCLQGCSLNCWSNYSISKRAVKTFARVQQKRDVGQAFNTVAVKPPPPLVQSMATASIVSDEEEPNLRRALMHVNDDNVKMIGIWGMGGVGKTHLLKQINSSLIRHPSFKVMILIVASKECSVSKIQGEIVKKLGLACENDVELQANIISTFLSQYSFLLFFDDLWEPLDLERIGVPLPLGVSGQQKRKVVFTTRLRKICSEMDVQDMIEVQCLGEEQAWRLFKEKVGDETIDSNPLIPPLAKEVAGESGGLPLVLITTGRAMSGKKDPKEWQHAIRQLGKSRLNEINPSGNDESIFRRLKFSYDSLNSDTLKQCFLCCSLWPEDHFIHKNELIHCWLGLGLINTFDDIPHAYSTGFFYARILQEACLLEEDVENERVKMHDVIRDMALWIARDYGRNKNKWVVEAGAELKEAPRGEEIWCKAEHLSLMFNEIETMCFPVVTDHSKLTAVMLQFNQLETITNFRTFIALTYLDLHRNNLSSFPTEICRLVNLQYLNLSANYIKELPKELQSLMRLKFLHLRHNLISTIPHGVISGLTMLQILDLCSSRDIECLHYLPAMFEELESLDDLKTIGITVQDVMHLERLTMLQNAPIRFLRICKLNELTSLLLSDSFLGNIQIQKNLLDLAIADNPVEKIVFKSSRKRRSCRLDNLEKLYFQRMDSLTDIIWEGLTANELFSRLNYLSISGCNQLENISWVLHLPSLRELEIISCDSMRQLIRTEADEICEEERRTPPPSFPCLRSVRVLDLPALDIICNPAFTVRHLESVVVRNCPNLRQLPFHDRNIPSKLKMISCEKEWWEALEWENDTLKSFFEPFLQEEML